MEMSYVRGISGVSGWDGEREEGIHKRYDMGVIVQGVHCGVVE